MSQFFSYTPKTPALDAAFAAFLKDRTVAIVGRSMIHDVEQGAFIDSHDVVIRVHQAIPYRPTDPTPLDNFKFVPENDPVTVGQFVPPDWHSRIGKRVNILYPKIRRSPWCRHHDEYHRRWLEAVFASGVKFLCRDVMSNQNHNQHAWLQLYAPMRYPSWELRDWIANRMNGERPESGTMAIADILSHDVKRVYITGFPCGFDKDICPDLPQPQQAPQLENLKFLYELRRDKKIDVDTRMQMLFDKRFGGME